MMIHLMHTTEGLYTYTHNRGHLIYSIRCRSLLIIRDLKVLPLYIFSFKCPIKGKQNQTAVVLPTWGTQETARWNKPSSLCSTFKIKGLSRPRDPNPVSVLYWVTASCKPHIVLGQVLATKVIQ
jgi:hypothetical protein